MIWWFLLLAAVGSVAYGLRVFADRVDEIEDDARHMYEHRTREPYGSTFVKILIGRDGR